MVKSDTSKNSGSNTNYPQVDFNRKSFNQYWYWDNSEVYSKTDKKSLSPMDVVYANNTYYKIPPNDQSVKEFYYMEHYEAGNPADGGTSPYYVTADINLYSITSEVTLQGNTAGGSGGAGGGIVKGRGYNNQEGSLNANAGLAGSAGGDNAGYGGKGGNSGYGGDWGSAGSSGQAGDTGGNGNNGNGYGGSAGQSGGAGGYAIHLATLPNDDVRNITWINSGNILGNIVKSISTDRS